MRPRSPLKLFFVLSATIIGLLVFLPLPAAATKATPSWWRQATDEALREGYSLLNVGELTTLLNSEAPHLLVDARLDYEYGWGHLPGAANFTFDPGDRHHLSKERRRALRKTLGSDRKRRIVFYCRSFR